MPTMFLFSSGLLTTWLHCFAMWPLSVIGLNTSGSINRYPLIQAKCHLKIYEPRHDKTNKVSVHTVKTQISLGIRPVWSESSLSAWRKLGSLATHWAHSEDSDHTGRMPRLIWVFAGRKVILLVLSCHSSYTLLNTSYTSFSMAFFGYWRVPTTVIFVYMMSVLTFVF